MRPPGNVSDVPDIKAGVTQFNRDVPERSVDSSQHLAWRWSWYLSSRFQKLRVQLRGATGLYE